MLVTYPISQSSQGTERGDDYRGYSTTGGRSSYNTTRQQGYPGYYYPEDAVTPSSQYGDAYEGEQDYYGDYVYYAPVQSMIRQGTYVTVRIYMLITNTVY